MPLRAANRSITRKPKLCGVNSYSGPGFPNPTISQEKPGDSEPATAWNYFFFAAGALAAGAVLVAVLVAAAGALPPAAGLSPAAASSFLPFLITSGSAEVTPASAAGAASAFSET